MWVGTSLAVYEEHQQEKGALANVAGHKFAVASHFPVVPVDVDGPIYIMMMVRHVSLQL